MPNYVWIFIGFGQDMMTTEGHGTLSQGAIDSAQHINVGDCSGRKYIVSIIRKPRFLKSTVDSRFSEFFGQQVISNGLNAAIANNSISI